MNSENDASQSNKDEQNNAYEHGGDVSSSLNYIK